VKIEISPETIETAINEQINEAVENALGSYSVRTSIADTLTSEIAGGAVGEALRRALASLDTDALTQHLAAEIQRAMTAAVVGLLEGGICNVLLTLRGLSSYSNGYAEARAEVLSDLRRDRRAKAKP